jgi:hypothetical protein
MPIIILIGRENVDGLRWSKKGVGFLKHEKWQKTAKKPAKSQKNDELTIKINLFILILSFILI